MVFSERVTDIRGPTFAETYFINKIDDGIYIRIVYGTIPEFASLDVICSNDFRQNVLQGRTGMYHFYI